ncbi:MAG: hypothetical protein F6J98_16430 [Moorea sp. SIO4G2]|nr:hypothetical protein [Moorena sp. SIO4G2]
MFQGFCVRISAEAEAVGHATRSRSVGFAETLHTVAARTEHRILLFTIY